MATLLRMPEVAANGTEAGLQEWAVAEGAEFAAGDVLATVETDKAVVEVEAEEAGVVLRTLVPAGAMVEVGAAIAVLTAVGESVEDIDAVLTALGVDGGGPAGSDRAATPMSERRDVGEEPAAPAADGPDHVQLPAAHGGRTFASPLARRLAAEAGIPIQQITGTGPGGRVRRRDVEAAQAAHGAGGASEPSPAAPPEVLTDAPTAPGAPTAPDAPTAPADRAAPAGTGGWTDTPHTRMRRAIASRLLESKQTTPHFYLRASVRVDDLMALRVQLNEARPETRISVNDLVIKAAARSHGLVPEMNVIWTADAMRAFDTVDIAMAVATPGGLLTPVVRDVSSLSIGAVATSTRRLVDRARAGGLAQAELEGGSMSVTNLGMYGTEEFAAIINPPQSAILAVGAARPEPVVVGGSLAVATVLHVTLSVDHRAVDGAVAAGWLAAFVATVEQPFGLLL